MFYDVICRLRMSRKSVKMMFLALRERRGFFSVNEDLPCDADNTNAVFSK